jgi:assimilatory nitrate reductase catalytic subunit
MHEGQDSEWIDYLDDAAGIYRAANIRDGRLNFCVFIAPSHELPPRSWLAGLFDKTALETAERVSLLAGRPGAGQRDSGQVVCSCFGVGRNTIVAAIRDQEIATTGQIGAALKAGTNCGSCIPELQRLIAETSAKDAA